MEKAVVINPDSPAFGKEVFLIRRMDFLRYVVSFTEDGKTYIFSKMHLRKLL